MNQWGVVRCPPARVGSSRERPGSSLDLPDDLGALGAWALTTAEWRAERDKFHSHISVYSSGGVATFGGGAPTLGLQVWTDVAQPNKPLVLRRVIHYSACSLSLPT